MANKPVDFDKKQLFIDTYLRRNKYKLVDDYVIKDGNRHSFAILVPGGGYHRVCSFIEGVPIAKKLNEKDISAFILYYRVGKKGRYPIPQDDLARAVKEILDNEDKYNIDVNNYSIWGSSAGGHLVASFGTDNMGYPKYKLPKPGCLVLIYPIISMNKAYTHIGSHDYLLGASATIELEEETSVERHVDSNYPKTFIWTSDNDTTVDYRNTLIMEKVLKDNNVEVECHIYEGDLHGYGPATGTVAEGWIDKAIKFWRG